MITNARQAIPVIRARELLQGLEIQSPDEIDIEKIAYYKNAEVRYEPLKGMDGSIVIKGGAAIITVNSSISYVPQKRFVIAHELGHFFLHPNLRQVETVDAAQTNNWSTLNAEEYEANLFAAELLMPQFLFAPKIKDEPPSFNRFEALADEFGTTLTATAVQFVLNSKEECAIISCAGRDRKWFIKSPGFSFFFHENGYVHGHSCAAEVGPNKRTARSSQIEADYWLQNFRGNHKAYLTEEARYFPVLDRTLSLLWIHDVI
jgi:Zn-dependent peptidase ImmA (M78 family)